jgi:hypothetical protein
VGRIGKPVVSADLRDFGLKDLQIRVQGARLIFHGTLRPGVPPGKGESTGRSNPRRRFTHALDLPYEVNVDEAEVQNENGLISIVLKKKESATQSDRLAQSSFKASMKRFSEKRAAPHDLETNHHVETLERYLDYHWKGIRPIEREEDPWHHPSMNPLDNAADKRRKGNGRNPGSSVPRGLMSLRREEEPRVTIWTGSRPSSSPCHFPMECPRNPGFARGVQPRDPGIGEEPYRQ